MSELVRDADGVLLRFDPKYRCTSTNRAGGRCRRASIPGGFVCRFHGGASSQARAAAQRRLLEWRSEGQVAAFVAELDLAGMDDPIAAMRESLRTAVALRSALEELVHGHLALTPDVAVETGRREALYGPDHLGDLRPHPLVEMLRVWTVEAGRLAKLALEVDLDNLYLRQQEALNQRDAERLTTVIEMAFSAFSEALAAAGVDPLVLRSVERSSWGRMVGDAIDATRDGGPRRAAIPASSSVVGDDPF